MQNKSKGGHLTYVLKRLVLKTISDNTVKHEKYNSQTQQLLPEHARKSPMFSKTYICLIMHGLFAFFLLVPALE
jgi:hypothetical protein